MSAGCQCTDDEICGRAGEDRVRLGGVVAERAVAELALELHVPLFREQGLHFVGAEHLHDTGETFRCAAAVVRHGLRAEQPDRVADEQLRQQLFGRQAREFLRRHRGRARRGRFEVVRALTLAVAGQHLEQQACDAFLVGLQ